MRRKREGKNFYIIQSSIPKAITQLYKFVVRLFWCDSDGINPLFICPPVEVINELEPLSTQVGEVFEVVSAEIHFDGKGGHAQ